MHTSSTYTISTLLLSPSPQNFYHSDFIIPLIKNANAKEASLWHVIRRDGGELVRDIVERGDQKKMWGGRHCREGEGSKVRWHGHVIRRDKGELVRDIMEWRDLTTWGSKHYREGEGRKVEMVWTRNEKRWRRAGQRHRDKTVTTQKVNSWKSIVSFYICKNDASNCSANIINILD